MIENNEIHDCLAYYRRYEELSKLIPDNVLIIDFEKLVLDKERTMQKVSNFLGIEYMDLLLESSFLGEPIFSEGKDYSSQILDRYEDLLLHEEIAKIEIEILRISQEKSLLSKLNSKILAILIFVLKRISFIIKSTTKYFEKRIDR